MKIFTLPVLLILSLFLGGCTLIDNNTDHAEIEFTYQNFFPVDFFISVQDPAKRQIILKDNFKNPDNETFPIKTDSYITANSGKLNVYFSMVHLEQTFAQGEFDVDLREDWRWSLSFFAGPADYNPLSDCFGCVKYKSYPVNPEVSESLIPKADSLYVIASGNYISEPVMF